MKINVNTIGIEFTFDLKEKGSKKVNFYRELYGCRRSSHGGKYLYIKDGVLSNLKYLKPTKSTIIVLIKDAKIIKNFFKKSNVLFNEKIVILNKAEAKELGLKFVNNWHKTYEELKGNENLIFSVDF